MGFLVYTGSKSLFESLDNVTVAGGDVSRTIVASGPCVLDALLVQYDAAQVSADAVTIAIQDADGTELHKWPPLDLTDAATAFDGVVCGPLGIESRNGLVAVLDNADTASDVVILNYLYRVGFA